MSLPSTEPGTTSLSKENIKVQSPKKDAPPCSAAYMQQMNPLFTGLLTPPESPIRYAQVSSVDTTAQSSPALTPGANSGLPAASKAPNALEALFTAIKDTKTDTLEQNDVTLSGRASDSGSTPATPTPIDFNNASEIIYSIIEQGVEEKMVEAVDQIRLHASRLEKSLASFHRENVDARDQNDTMSRQLDLHYRTIEQNIEEFKTQSKTMNTMIGAQADNLAATITMVSHLSQVVTNLPMALNQVVYTAVQQQAQQAIRDIMFAQQQAMFSVSDVSGTRQSVSSDESFSHYARHHRGLGFKFMPSMHHSNSSSNSTASSTKRGFRYSLKRLFRSSK
ncbi:hypothetical protein TRIATDRAFT_315364 [Trichoderma atroviride IMI 206040]|uniref:Uncharacterized protein n=2 Tax=Hypocrea atroviridis TaxID=63577 RepID=G9NJC3_HYPAI|nr:uncharacterized protein TRIATDRAFT_315364 [Trichoderma atroviride IMI 206040]EHK48997.1 hypothetical protein TRIATDRAFT_315364 [Trichoderma atroviride IMI 206040]